MTNQERRALNRAKREHRRSIKNKVRHQTEKDVLLKRFIDSPIPNWGSLKIKLI